MTTRTDQSGDWDQWYQLWSAGEVEFGSWFDHTIGWWNAYTAPENEGKILWVTYEELKQESDETISRKPCDCMSPLLL